MAMRQKIVAIVEDDPSMLRATRDLLDAHGFATIAFASAEEFLARRTREKVGCVLLDIHLGGMSGIELRRQLKVSSPGLPIIFMTGLDDDSIEREALDEGCVAFLRKPFPQRELIDAIKKAVP
jgi:FixJ family two-component response regulator